VKAFDKRDGSGAYNWGTPSDELAASEEPGMSPIKDSEETPVDVDVEVTQDAEFPAGEDKENVEAEVETLTYEEYKAKELETRKKPEFNLRKANEGEKLKGLKELKSKPSEEDSETLGSLYFPKKEYVISYKQSGRVQEKLDLEFKYGAGENRHMDTERGGRRGGRGGRGRGRGRGGSDAPARNDSPMEGGGGFGSAPTDDAGIQLEDTSEFPSLMG